jgi:predicted transcriptional regulator
VTANRIKHTFRLPPALSSQLADYAARKRTSQALIVEAALTSFLSPDGSERLEAAFTRRLDRLTRQTERAIFHSELGNEAIALFVRFWLTNNAPLPDTALAAAQAMGRERYQGFVEALSRRMEQGPRLQGELSVDHDERSGVSNGDPIDPNGPD